MRLVRIGLVLLLALCVLGVRDTRRRVTAAGAAQLYGPDVNSFEGTFEGTDATSCLNTGCTGNGGDACGVEGSPSLTNTPTCDTTGTTLDGLESLEMNGFERINYPDIMADQTADTCVTFWFQLTAETSDSSLREIVSVTESNGNGEAGYRFILRTSTGDVHVKCGTSFSAASPAYTLNRLYKAEMNIDPTAQEIDMVLFHSAGSDSLSCSGGGNASFDGFELENPDANATFSIDDIAIWDDHCDQVTDPTF